MKEKIGAKSPVKKVQKKNPERKHGRILQNCNGSSFCRTRRSWNCFNVALAVLQKVENQLLVCGDTKVPNVNLEKATVSATIAMEINLATFGRIPPLAPPSGTTCFNHFSQKLQTCVWSFAPKTQSKAKIKLLKVQPTFYWRGRRTHP